ncbi:MAG: RnfABCDGE type electron transport complex subunit B [Eubacteriales bacterium]
MDLVSILIATGVVGGVGIVIALFLGVASNAFRVEVNEQEVAVLDALPGNNCGGCGYAGCSGLAKAIANGEAAVGACPVGGDAVADEIARIMGMESEGATKQVAYVRCNGNCNHAKTDYNYTGVEDCRMLAYVPSGGPKSCNDGCLGYGTCVTACPFDAIHIVDGVAVVDKGACKACSKCIEVCPKNLIALVPYETKYIVSCQSKEKGPATMKACDVGCIGCGICVKNCPKSAIKIEEFHAVIDQELCVGCGICAQKCPKHSIECI